MAELIRVGRISGPKRCPPQVFFGTMGAPHGVNSVCPGRGYFAGVCLDGSPSRCYSGDTTTYDSLTVFRAPDLSFFHSSGVSPSVDTLPQTPERGGICKYAIHPT